MWKKIGEIEAKCDRITNIPLMPEYAQKLHAVFLAKGALATTAIEGNTLSEEEVMGIVKGEAKIPEVKKYLQQEVENIIHGCNGIFKELKSGGDKRITVKEIKEYNALVLKDLPLEKGEKPGHIRQKEFGVPGYRGAPAKECQYLLDRMCEWLNEEIEPKGKELHFAYWLIKAILFHLYLVWIHPFADGNGRTARLLEFKCLLASGVPTPTAHLLSNYYNETRDEYYRQLSQASKSGGEIIPFISYAIDGFLEELNKHLNEITEQQIDVHWTSYVHEQFREKTKKIDRRRRQVALDLGKQKDFVPISKIRDLSAEAARRYGNLSIRSVSYDLKVLKELGLVIISGSKAMANRQKILGLLPQTMKR